MSKINWARVIVGGLAAGLVINISQSILNIVVVAEENEAALEKLGVPVPDSGSALAVWVIWSFVLGISAVWLYAAIRPRYGAGAKTALCAGATVWFLVYFWSSLSMYNMGFFPLGLLAIGAVWGFVEMALATVLGAWLYKEE